MPFHEFLIQWIKDNLDVITALGTIVGVLATIIGGIYAYWRKFIRKKDTEPKKVLHKHIHKHEHKHVIVCELPKPDEEAKKLHENEKVGFVREDQAVSYEIIASPDEEFQILLTALKPYLSENDLDILISAIAVIEAQTERKYEESGELHKRMRIRFGQRALRFYDLISGKLFHERLLPFIKELDRNYGENLQLKKRFFEEYLESFIKTTTDRIWVTWLRFTDLEHKIEQRIKTYNLNELWIYASGNKVQLDTVENICRLFVSKNRIFSLEISEMYRIRNKFGRTFKLARVA